MTNTPGNRKWVVIIMTLIMLTILSYLTAGFFSLLQGSEISTFGNVALIKIEGAIVGGDYKPPLAGDVTSSQDIIGFIESADESPVIKAIVLEINSGGGTAVASKEIADAVKRANKTTYAVIREIGTSGAYWVASAADEVIASELSLTGSIGVISSYLEFSGLFEKYGITYQRLVGGDYKDIGSPFKELTMEEELLLQQQINKVHNYFISQIAENRNMEEEEIKKIATGMFYLGMEAKDLGLVDHLGDIETAKTLIKEQLNITEVQFSEYEKVRTFLDILNEVFSEQSFYVGRGIGSSVVAESSRGIMT